MTISNLRCDSCDALLPGLIPDSSGEQRGGGVRFSYHPGDPRMRDDSGVLCGGCWTELASRLREPRAHSCAECGAKVAWRSSLHLRPAGSREAWQLCSVHAAEILNRLTTVEPKFDPETFQLPLAREKEGPQR